MRMPARRRRRTRYPNCGTPCCSTTPAAAEDRAQDSADDLAAELGTDGSCRAFRDRIEDAWRLSTRHRLFSRLWHHRLFLGTNGELLVSGLAVDRLLVLREQSRGAHHLRAFLGADRTDLACGRHDEGALDD